MRKPAGRLAATLLAVSSLVMLGAVASSAKDPRSVPLERLLGQLLMGRVTGTAPSPGVLGRIRRGELGGVIIFGDNFTTVASLKALIRTLQKAAREGGQPPLLIAVDQEGGIVKRLPDGPPAQSARQLGAAGSARLARRSGVETGRYLKAIGIGVDLAPVLDVPDSDASFLGSRAFAKDPTTVTRVGVQFALGLQDVGVDATAKHFPGLGTAPANTDLGSVTIKTSRRELLRRLEPFRQAVKSGVRLVMVSTASYPNLDPTGLPAAISPAIVNGLLRDELGFRGVVITDTMGGPGLRPYSTPAFRALNAGVDILLYSDGELTSADAFQKLLQRAREGELTRAVLERSYRRVVQLKTGA